MEFSYQARIKKIMQTDEDVGKVAAAVPVIICILYINSLKVAFTWYVKYVNMPI